MVKKRSVLGLNTGCTVRKGLMKMMKRQNNTESKGERVGKVLLLPHNKSFNEEHISKAATNFFGFDDGGIKFRTLPLKPGKNAIESISNFDFGSTGVASLNKRKRWETFDRIARICTEKSNSKPDDFSIETKNKHQDSLLQKTKAKNAKSKKAKINSETGLRLIAGTWKFFFSDFKFRKVGAFSYCDSFTHVVIKNPSKNLNLTMKSLSNISMHTRNKDLNQGAQGRPNYLEKLISYHHNQHNRALQRPEKWKIEKSMYFLRNSILLFSNNIFVVPRVISIANR